MDVYHKILLRIYEITGGKVSEEVDFVELLKDEGFYPSYSDIFNQLTRNGWVSDTGNGDNVKITPWGVREARKVEKHGGTDDRRIVLKKAKALAEEIRQMLVVAEEVADDPDDKGMKQVEAVFSKVKERMDDLRSRL